MRYTPARPAEQPFVQRASEWAQRAVARQRWELTDFLSPREQDLLAQTAHRHHAVVAFYGGTEAAERKRALVMPDDWQPEPVDFQVQALRVDGVAAQAVSHGSVLGSLLGTGLDRRVIGDVALTAQSVYVWVCASVVPHLLAFWRQVDRWTVSPVLADGPADWPGPLYEPKAIHVHALRADAVIAQACRWPRERARAAVESGLVSRNFAPFAKPDEPLVAGDILSVRGFGRIKVVEVVGVSKRNRQLVEIGILQSR